MRELVQQLKALFPNLKYTASTDFSWSPESCQIYYVKALKTDEAAWTLLHETGHAVLGHKNYDSDIELLKMEVAAWQKAQQIAKSLKINIDEDHIQDCLDTYRSWLNQRSSCPRCGVKSMQESNFKQYRCYNCHKSWLVSDSRFSRNYRRTKNSAEAEILFA